MPLTTDGQATAVATTAAYEAYDPFPPDLRDALDVLRAAAGHCLILAGYELRPYDAGRDRRVWRWQRRGCWRTTAEGRAVVARLTDALRPANL